MKKNERPFVDHIKWWALSTTMLRKNVQELFEQEGTLPFEHGYKPPVITMDYAKYKINYIDKNGLHCRNMESKSMRVIPFKELRRTQIFKVLEECNKYVTYCMYYA